MDIRCKLYNAIARVLLAHSIVVAWCLVFVGGTMFVACLIDQLLLPSQHKPEDQPHQQSELHQHGEETERLQHTRKGSITTCCIALCRDQRGLSELYYRSI